MDKSIIAPRVIKKKGMSKGKWVLVIIIGILLAGGSYWTSSWYFDGRAEKAELNEQKALELNKTLVESAR